MRFSHCLHYLTEKLDPKITSSTSYNNTFVWCSFSNYYFLIIKNSPLMKCIQLCTKDYIEI